MTTPRRPLRASVSAPGFAPLIAGPSRFLASNADSEASWNAAIGVQGAQGVGGSQGTQGAQGAQGPQGKQGAQGAQGTQGSKGSQGAQGTQGVGGAQGATGSQGSQGSKGSQGAQGSQGDTGAQGVGGSTGAQGSKGSQGSQGAQGTQGVQGSQGTQGATGNGITVLNWRCTRVNVTGDSTGGTPTVNRAFRIFGDGFNSAGIPYTIATGAFVGAAVFDGVFICPRAGTLQYLSGRVEVGMAIDYTWTVCTLSAAKVPTFSSITITIPAGSTATISDTVHTLSVSAGDRIILMSQQATGTSNNTTTRPQATLLLL